MISQEEEGRDDTESEDSERRVSCSDSPDGAVGGGIEEQVPPTALLVPTREEIASTANDAKMLYIRGLRACRLFPIRIFDRRSRLRAHVEKHHDAPNGEACPSSMVLRLITALFSRDQILTASGLLLGVYVDRPGAVHTAIELDCRAR